MSSIICARCGKHLTDEELEKRQCNYCKNHQSDTEINTSQHSTGIPRNINVPNNVINGIKREKIIRDQIEEIVNNKIQEIEDRTKYVDFSYGFGSAMQWKGVNKLKIESFNKKETKRNKNKLLIAIITCIIVFLVILYFINH
jgi:hypothetical protein